MIADKEKPCKPQRTALVMAVLVSVAALLVAACGGNSTDVASGDSQSVGPEDSTETTNKPDHSTETTAGGGQTDDSAVTNGTTNGERVETRSAVLQLAEPLLGGSTFNPDSVAGRDVLLWFWAPW